jgi:phage terminase large subunit-like protein
MRPAEGHLTITPGSETDFDRIEADVPELCRRHRVASVGFDPWQSTRMAQRLRAEGVDMLEFRATTQSFSPVILELNAAMRAGRLRHDGDPVLEWCVGNVVGRPDRRGNLHPAKQRPERKIDAAVALMMDFLRNPVIA